MGHRCLCTGTKFIKGEQSLTHIDMGDIDSMHRKVEGVCSNISEKYLFKEEREIRSNRNKIQGLGLGESLRD